MEYRSLDVTIVSAEGVKKADFFSRRGVYAMATLGNDPRTRQQTHVDKEGGRNPRWNFTMKFSVDLASCRQNLALNIQIFRKKKFFGDGLIGQVHVPIAHLLESPGDGEKPQTVSYQVRKPSGKPKGVLNFSYRFGETITVPFASAAPSTSVGMKGEEPVMAYPAASAYPPRSVPYAPQPYPPTAYPPPANGYQPAGYDYGAPPPGYGYPPTAGYGYPPVVPPQAKPAKNKLGMGLGAGLLGGALGGLLIGDMISDASAYDAGYDAGLADGFDF